MPLLIVSCCCLQEKDIPLTLTQLIPISYHKEHHHGHDHGKIEHRSAAKVNQQAFNKSAPASGHLEPSTAVLIW